MASTFTETAVPASGWTLLAAGVTDVAIVRLTVHAVKIAVLAAGDPAPTGDVDAVPGLPLIGDPNAYSDTYPTPRDIYARARYAGDTGLVSWRAFA